jgi:hypothetical protein
MKKTTIKYGLIAGGILSVLMGINIIIMKDAKNLAIAEIFGYTSMLIALSAIFIGIKKYRDEYLGGTISYLQAFKVGILITLIASVIYVISWAVLSEIFIPDFHQKYSEYYLKNLEENGASLTELNDAKIQIAYYQEKFKNPLFRWLMSFLEIFPVGLVMTLIASFFHKRK